MAAVSACALATTVIGVAAGAANATKVKAGLSGTLTILHRDVRLLLADCSASFLADAFRSLGSSRACSVGPRAWF